MQSKYKTKEEYRSMFKTFRKGEANEVHISILKCVSIYIERNLEKLKSNEYIGIYWPLEGEVDLRPLKENLNIRLALPSVSSDGNISYHPWLDRPLSKDYYGIPAPIYEKNLEAKAISLLLIPSLSIDQRGVRLGYGGGFFDRLRSQSNWKEIMALAILPQSCISKAPLPKDPWDIPLDGWINEYGEHLCNKKK